MPNIRRRRLPLVHVNRRRLLLDHLRAHCAGPLRCQGNFHDALHGRKGGRLHAPPQARREFRGRRAIVPPPRAQRRRTSHRVLLCPPRRRGIVHALPATTHGCHRARRREDGLLTAATRGRRGHARRRRIHGKPLRRVWRRLLEGHPRHRRRWSPARWRIFAPARAPQGRRRGHEDLFCAPGGRRVLGALRLGRRWRANRRSH
mmetsp:Transcript_81841/g.237315  ORF Transcript_81841/g.237315 Transcript_81841/m.237315 type:complete len:203 (+) Transcript_81841:983-1591(+)